jgi:hypothetical protein
MSIPIDIPGPLLTLLSKDSERKKNSSMSNEKAINDHLSPDISQLHVAAIV